MQLQTVLVAALSTVALAAPIPSGAKWTFTNVKRTCNAADTSCTWSFGIDATSTYPKIPERFPLDCSYVVKSVGSTPASKNPNAPEAKCGFFTVSAGWNAGGWTTLSVKDTPKDWITFPAYEETVVAGGKTVKPNRSYPVQLISSL